MIETQTLSPWIIFALSLVIGLPMGWGFYVLIQTSTKKRAQAEATEIIQEAKDEAELRLLDEKERTQEIEMELWTKEESFLLKTEEKIEELEELVAEKKQKADNQYSQIRQKTVDYENEIKTGEANVQNLEKKYQGFKSQIREINKNYVASLGSRLGTTDTEVIQSIQDECISQAKRRAEERILQVEEETKEHSEMMAKHLIDLALVRFARPYSSERGIAPVYFETPDQRKVLCDPAGINIKTISDVTGCDIIVQDDMEMIGVAGFDPVRRELTRRLLERLLKEKKPVQADFIKKTFENIKREVLSLIKKDGDNLAKELGLQGLHPEIRQMMGSLRYRYSFTQNQYFHCGEVGWLCGLLAQELKTVDVKKARRAGMLHDLGKSMDHEKEGGHAVIGANFIEARNEAPDIVHAVRAHHFDEQPSTDLAYLVIAADAISGARPGARRSTMESYNQKVNELDSIARSFDGVTDCYVLNGGRECRVIVNGKKVNDLAALKMSRDIAARIESECNYPGQIKVLVVRETYVVETTKGHG
ncbi:MAG: ribonuclease Y [Oligoflexia bacterium]|nr:MAG: ribonuclease Y [Oligoflexia bacterium]